MKTPLASRSLFVVVLLALAACGAPVVTAPVPRVAPDTNPPAITREMRGVWIATVGNIDWPSRSGLPAEQQRAELDALLDRAVAGRLNAVVLQVRPAGDALYSSSLEPWASWLSGTQGTDPGYDPLAYAVSAAHARGLELHAWINPFRAGNAKDSAALAPSHMFRAHRELGRVYGTQLWFDPGEPAVQDRVIAVVRDIVQRYDVDGIHADDYFYPYPQNDSAGHPIVFPDGATYARSGSALTLDDWRRDNVNRFVERTYREVHALKPAVKVGISPFGIWRPGNPASVAGFDAYAKIYADSRLWLQRGWVDYLTPQLYWSIAAPQQSYPALLDWWLAQNSAGRHVWPGLAAYRVNSGTPNAFGTNEIANQVTLTRARTGGTGHILYNATTALTKNGGVIASLDSLYRQRALVPASPWLATSGTPAPPTFHVTGGRSLAWSAAAGAPPRWWLLRTRAAATKSWTTRVLFGDRLALTLDSDIDRAMLNAVSAAGLASADAVFGEP